jgi:hypothetical protein
MKKFVFAVSFRIRIAGVVDRREVACTRSRFAKRFLTERTRKLFVHNDGARLPWGAGGNVLAMIFGSAKGKRLTATSGTGGKALARLMATMVIVSSTRRRDKGISLQ